MHLLKRFIALILFWVFIVFVWYTPLKPLRTGNNIPMKIWWVEKDIQLPWWFFSSHLSWAILVSWSVFALEDSDKAKNLLRNQVISWLMQEGFEWRTTAPYSWSDANGVMTYQWTWYTVWQWLSQHDPLDERIVKIFSLEKSEEFIELWMNNTVRIWSWVRADREDVYLFKNQQDLMNLWYEVISSRRRISTDVAYRRKNIAQSFSMIGHIRVIPPSWDLTFMDAAQYDGITRENYEYGYVVVWNQEKMDYGGWICGASSAIYQWIVSNWSLQTPRVRNHTRRYWYLYDAYINGELVTTPWIDSAVFDGSLDLEMVNTASHPIVLVMNYDGTVWGVEEVFTLWLPSDRQEIEFLSSYPVDYTWPSWIGTWQVTLRWGCYTRMIGNEKVKRCYRKVSE